MFSSLVERARGLASLFWREVAKFGTVGGVAFVIDNGLTWILMHSVMDGSQTKARLVGASVATVFSWLANRLWTFRHRRQANVSRELSMFLLINGIGIAISTGFTAIAEYWLGITENTPLFLAGVLGILVATVVRFFAYRFWVFNEELDSEPEWEKDRQLFHPDGRPRTGMLKIDDVTGRQRASGSRTTEARTAEARTPEARTAEARTPEARTPEARTTEDQGRS